MSHFYSETQPHGEIARAVDCFWTFDASAATSQLVLPDGCCDLVLHFWGGLCTAEWVGAMTRPQLAQIRQGESLIGARFRPGMLTAVLEMSSSHAPDTSGQIESQWWLSLDLEAQLASVKSTSERINALQNVLRIRRDDDRVQAAVERLVQSGGLAGREELMDLANLGERQLRRAIQARTGLPPKQLARVLRFRRAQKMVREGAPGGLADIAVQCGYFDQAHMGKDFQAFGGTSPGAFLGMGSSPIFTSRPSAVTLP